MNKRTHSSKDSISRRRMITAGGLGALGLTFADWLSVSDVMAAAASGETNLEPLNRFPRMTQEYFVQRVRRVEAAAEKVRSELKSKRDAQAYVKSVQKRIDESFGPWPKKTPLKPRIMGTIERDAYRIENVIFESRPGFLVTGNLYLPKGRTGPLPGVIGVCGHSSNGKAAESYQSFSQGLALMGYVVFIIDPIGQGERSQYVETKDDGGLKDTIRVGTRQHLHGGNQQFLVGESIASWRAWDGIRALDYLLTRPEVDPKHIGITGNSGGGTMTTWLCGVERRWTMGAPSCFVTTFRRNLENELPADTEQCPPRVLELGLDHSDFIAAMAPKPVILLAKEKDYFDARGGEEAFARLQRLYKLLGKPENIRLFIGPTYHGYSQENREAMYQWFNRTTGVSDAQTEPNLTMEKDETLYCAPKGQVATLKSRTVFSFTAAKSKALAKRRGAVKGAGLRKAVARALNLKPNEGVPDYRILRAIGGRKYPTKYFANYAITTEPGVQAIVYRLNDEPLYSRPPRGRKRAVLYVSHQSSDAELRDEPLVKELFESEKDAAFFTCDVRGVGDSRPNTTNRDSYLSPYGSDYFYAVHSIMLSQPYLGQKTFDVLRVLDWLKDNGHTEIHLAGKGWGSLAATFAALFSDQVTQVTLKNGLTSYAEVAETEHYNWPLSCLVDGVLERFDLPDCYAALKSKKLRQIEMWNAQGEA
jgi:dienelactone hydrolase